MDIYFLNGIKVNGYDNELYGFVRIRFIATCNVWLEDLSIEATHGRLEHVRVQKIFEGKWFAYL